MICVMSFVQELQQRRMTHARSIGRHLSPLDWDSGEERRVQQFGGRADSVGRAVFFFHLSFPHAQNDAWIGEGACRLNDMYFESMFGYPVVSPSLSHVRHQNLPTSGYRGPIIRPRVSLHTSSRWAEVAWEDDLQNFKCPIAGSGISKLFQ